MASAAVMVAPMPLSSSIDEDMVVVPINAALTAEQQARKRRREYLSSQRGAAGGAAAGTSLETLLDEALGIQLISTTTPTTSTSSAESGTSLLMFPATEEEEEDVDAMGPASSAAVAPKKCKVSEDEASATSYLSDDNESLSFPHHTADREEGVTEMVLSMGSTATSNVKSNNKTTKKPQRKYDPDVPMTKEEAAAWRREQRRKRNRESAAASRQRQRDRIDELETELASWKAMHQDVLDKIKVLEEAGVSADARTASPTFDATTSTTTGVSTVTPRASPTAVVSSIQDDKKSNRSMAAVVPGVPQDVHNDDQVEENEQGLEGLLPPKMISRPAVS